MSQIKTKQWYALMSKPQKDAYAEGMVRFGDLPLSIPETLIEQLRIQESQFAERAVDLDHFQNGDVVTIKSGSFEGLSAVFERYSGEERVILLMNILNEQAKVAVPSTDVYKTA